MFDFTFLPVTQYEGLMNVTQADSFSALLAAFFEKKGKAERMQRRTGDLHKTVTNARDRVARKLAAQKRNSRLHTTVSSTSAPVNSSLRTCTSWKRA